MTQDQAAPGVYDPLETVLYFKHCIIDSPALWAKDLHLLQTLFNIDIFVLFKYGGGVSIINYKIPRGLRELRRNERTEGI